MCKLICYSIISGKKSMMESNWRNKHWGNSIKFKLMNNMKDAWVALAEPITGLY